MIGFRELRDELVVGVTPLRRRRGSGLVESDTAVVHGKKLDPPEGFDNSALDGDGVNRKITIKIKAEIRRNRRLMGGVGEGFGEALMLGGEIGGAEAGIGVGEGEVG